MTLPHIVG
jgi:hypothetical protein